MKANITLIALVAIASSCLAQTTDQPKFTAADVPGKWMGFHWGWSGVVVFHADGTLVRPQIGVGRWELVTEENETKLVISWDGYGRSKSTMVSADYFREALPQGAFSIYRVPPPPAQQLPDGKATDPSTTVAKARLDNSVWQLIPGKSIFLRADGSVRCNWDESRGTWKLIGANALVFDVPWQPAPAKIVTTNRDATILRWTDDENILVTRKGN